MRLSFRLNVQQRYVALIVSVVLAVVTYWLYKTSLSAFWRFDDGAHLKFATTYSPSQYFFDPAITTKQSLFLTPWNIFFYSINLRLFGFNPEGFYFHQLALLWMSSLATFFFLRLWVPSIAWALFGSVMFLVGAPTSHIANELMTGHYATGLLFSVTALYFYVRSVREKRLNFAVLGALLYFLATACKEVYVPIVCVLLFLPEGSFKSRFRYSIPFDFVALIYVSWRYAALGRLFGGYDSNAGYNPRSVVEAFGHLPLLLFGTSGFGKLALILFLGLIAYGIFIKKLNLKLTLVAMVLLLVPLIPVTADPGITEPNRYLFFVWWGASVFLAILLSMAWGIRKGKNILLIIGLLLMGASLKNNQEETAHVLDTADLLEKSYGFLLNSNSRQIFLVPDFDQDLVPYFNLVLSGMISSEKKLEPSNPERAKIVFDVDYLTNLNLNDVSVWKYDAACHCVREVTRQIQTEVSEYRKRLQERPLSINLSLKNSVISWDLGPYQKGTYEAILNNIGLYTLSIRGSHPYSSEQPLDGFIRYKSPEGWVTLSPQFHLDSVRSPSWAWAR